MNKRSQGKDIVYYILTLLGMSYIIQGVILVKGGIDSPSFNILAPVIMFLPALLTILYLVISKEGLKGINWSVGKPIYLVYAALIPSLLALLAISLISHFGWGDIVHFNIESGQVEIVKGRFVLGQGIQSLGFFALNYLVTTLVFSLVSGVLALGEELGWRGFLQPRLIDRAGIVKGIIILGLIWGFWHFPMIVNGYNYPESPVLGAFILFPLTTVCASFFLAWLTIKAQSFWPAVLAHGSVNAFVGSFVAGMNYGPHRLKAEILVLGLWVVVALLSYLSIRRSHPAK